MKKGNRFRRTGTFLASVFLGASLSVTSVFASSSADSFDTESSAAVISASASVSEEDIPAASSADSSEDQYSTEADISLTESDTESVVSEEEAAGSVTESADETSETESNSDLAGDTAEVASQVMYRLYNPNSGEHFYTASAGERDVDRSYGWRYEGYGWYSPVNSSVPVYRLYNPNAGDHHYTTNAYEKDYLVSLGWRYEGIGWYSSSSDKVPVYRAYNPNAVSGAHHFTTSFGEYQALGGYGWNLEGIAWYAEKAGDNTDTNTGLTIYNGVDYSGIYNYTYYKDHNPSAVSAVSSKAGNLDYNLLAYFLNTGITKGQTAKEGVTSASKAYQDVLNKLHPKSAEDQIANNLSSRTKYLILVNKSKYRVYVYEGSKGNWTKIKDFACVVGKPSTPSPTGTFTSSDFGYYFNSGSVRCFYWTRITGNYLFHSTLYAQTSTPQREVDGTMSAAASHGCVRLKLDNAYWIYTNIGQNARGTTIYLYS